MIPTLYPCFRHWANVGTIWLYSDPHFGDTELAKGINRPDDETQIALINKKVGRKDTLIILGDIGDIESARKLRGYKVLICGNHDGGGSNYTEVFDEVYTGPVFITERIVLSHEPLPGVNEYALNIHGHDHMAKSTGKNRLNVCSNVINYTPVNFNQLVKSGVLANIPSIHRITIDNATDRKAKRQPRTKKGAGHEKNTKP